MITRRHLITTGLITALPLYAGCSANLEIGESAPELGQITIENSDEMSHTIHVSVARDSELIYGSSHELDGVSQSGSDGSGNIDSAILDNDSWEGTTGTWTVYTRVDEDTSWQQHPIKTDGETTCYAVRLKIETDASVTSFTPDCASWPVNGER